MQGGLCCGRATEYSNPAKNQNKQKSTVPIQTSKDQISHPSKMRKEKNKSETVFTAPQFKIAEKKGRAKR